MIKRQISFLFEDPGFCIDVFCTIAEPVRYYNRDTESGAWYSSTPDWNENGSLIREDLIFEVIANGVVCALDGKSCSPCRMPEKRLGMVGTGKTGSLPPILRTPLRKP